MITITIETDNAAFGTSANSIGHEVARILRETAKRLNEEAIDLRPCQPTRLRDINGNTVGHFEVRP